MSKTQPTPGPWVVAADSDVESYGYYGIFPANGLDALIFEEDFIAVANLNHKNREANARLIAAAPELLEALQALLIHPDGGTYRNSKNSPDVKAAHAAIAKATGGSA